MERVLILTGAQIPPRNDKKIKDVLRLTIPSKLRYANKWDYDFLLINSFKIYSQYNMTEKHLGFTRFIFALELLNHYDIVMWLDGDSIVTNEKYNIHDFLTDQHVFFFSYDWHIDPNKSSAFSAGNFILKSSSKNDFLTENFLKIAQSYMDHNLQEQITLNHMFSLPEFNSYFKILPHRFLNAVPFYVSEVWRDYPPIINPWDENCFLAHFTGIPDTDRIRIIKENFEKYIY